MGHRPVTAFGGREPVFHFPTHGKKPAVSGERREGEPSSGPGKHVSKGKEGQYPSNVPASEHGNDYNSDSPVPHSGISGASLSSSSTSSICDWPEGRNNKSLDQDKKPNIRASSVPRPRAVLSSPDNDNMVGHQNRLSRERERERERERRLKGQVLRRTAAGQCKPTLKNVRSQSPVNTREPPKVTSSNNHPKTKPSLIHGKRPSQTPGKGKSNPAWI